LLFAGLILGMTTSIRIVGPLAGLLITFLYLSRYRAKVLLPLMIYWITAAVAIYITWPILWGDPVNILLDRILRVSSFTEYEVLYFGRRIASQYLPWHFVPSMISLQLTIPSVVFTVTGFISGWIGCFRKERNTDVLVLLTIWIALPVFIAAMGLIPIYNNFRHLLFILPPVFIFAGFGLDRLFSWVTIPLIRVLFVILILLPGIVGIVQLHPYQYIYYNEFIGGVDGAAGRFEMDYWCTSFREVMDYVNEVAPNAASVAMWGGITTSRPFARADLELYSDRMNTTDPDYAIGCKYALENPDFFPELDSIYEIRRGEALLAVIKQKLD
jgi:hypothetical protein